VPNREGKAKKGKVVKVTNISAIYWADTPGPIPIKIGVHVASHDVIKIFRILNFQGFQIHMGPKFPLSH